MKKLLTSICFALLTFNAFAFDYYHKGYLANIKTPELRRTLSEVAEAADNRDFVKANKLIDKVLSNQTAPEFSAKPNIDGPLALQLKAAKAYYRFLMVDPKTPGPGGTDEEMKNNALAALKEYKKKANGKKWNAYESFYHRLIQYYYDKKDFEKAEEYLNKICEYNPEFGALAYLFWGMEFNLPTKTIESKIKPCLNKDSPYYSYAIIRSIQLKQRDGNNVLNKVAFAQPGTEEGLKLVSRIIDERKKVEIILPSVRAD